MSPFLTTILNNLTLKLVFKFDNNALHRSLFSIRLFSSSHGIIPNNWGADDRHLQAEQQSVGKQNIQK
jgi:hypothetical protein